MSTTPSYPDVIYGVPLNVEECFAHPVPAYVFAAASAAYSYNSNEIGFGDNDFDDVIEILAHVDSDVDDDDYEEALPAVTASPITTVHSLSSFHGLPIAAAQAKNSPIVTVAIPEPCYMKTAGVEAQPWDELEAAKVVFAEPELCAKGIQDLSLYRHGDESVQKKQRRIAAEDDYGLKEKRMREQPFAAPPSAYFSLDLMAGAPASSASKPHPSSAARGHNARQIATARRERENGKFKKARTKWVSVTELFKNGAGSSSSQDSLS